MATRKQINRTIAVGLKEMRKFKENKPQHILPLQQAGNKMYKAYTQLLDAIRKKRPRTKDGVETITYELNDSSMVALYKVVRHLHSFFYGGEGGRSIKEDIVWSAKQIKHQIVRYKIK